MNTASLRAGAPSGAPRHATWLRRASLTLLFCTSAGADAQTSAPPTPDPIVAKADQGRILGSATAPIWMLIVSDFQCPFCKQWHDSTWQTLRRAYVQTGKVRVAYVNFPLDQHRNAKAAALVAMCASAQDKFWPVADRLFATQARWENLSDPAAAFDDAAKSARADLTALHACVANPAIAALVEADRTRMTRAGTGSTPTFFIGNTRIEGAQPLAVFRRTIDAELAAKRKP